MRIFYTCDPGKLWDDNLYLPLIDLGHEVIKFDYDLKETFKHLNPADLISKKFIEKNRPQLSKELVKQVKRHHDQKQIDLFFTYLYDACINPEAIDEIKSMGIATINWYCNASYQLDLVSKISPHYNYCLVPEKFRIDDYKALGANPIYCQEAANPNIYKPYNLTRKFDVTFIGQAYGERPDIISHLLQNKIDVRVWGYGWENYCHSKNIKLFKSLSRLKKLFSSNGWRAIQYKLNRLFSFKKETTSTITSKVNLPQEIIGGHLNSSKEMIQIYSRSKINLGFSCCGNTHLEKRITQIRLRDFEVPMSGGFYITEYMQELEEFFEIDKEIVCYSNQEELVDKIRFYLSNEAAREKIRAAGRSRCLKDHSWQKRLNTVFEKIGIISDESTRKFDFKKISKIQETL
jgi:spore maturation protein CgeB